MSILTVCKRKLTERRGFSLAEVLLAVAILVILLALLIPNLIKTQKDLRQKELDAKAEIIYVAAQNQLAKLRAGGNAQLYQSAAAYRLPDCPSDAIPPRDESGSIRNNYYYLSSAELTADSAVMNPDVVDPALLGANWIIEYQPEYGKVHAVFYWETKKNNFFTYLTEAFSNNPDLRDRSQRFRAKNAGLGYYGGDESRSDTGASVSLSPQITLNRGEVLSAQLYCEKPRSSEELTFEFTIFDEFGHAYTQKFFKNQQNIYGLSCSVTVTLDDLSDTNTRFEQLYGSNSGHNEGEKLVAGSKLTFRLTVRGKSGTVEPGTVEDNVGANSLFDDRSDHSTAVITCGRHLQNLDESSGLNKHLDQLRIQTAQQRTDINLKSDEWLDAQSAYGLSYFNGTTGGTPVFKPVSNGELTRYNGCQNRILGLYTEGDGAALFADISGDTTLENIRLSGTMAKGGAVSAALVGTVNGADNAVTNCGVYLDSADYLGKSDKYTWISGGVTGGLVGKVADGGALTITDSFAATVLSASSVSGGLVGRVEDGGALTVRTSYADSYITGPRTGGMVGDGSVEEITNCYAAGFQTATASAAGLVNGTLKSAAASYTVSSMAGQTVYDVARTGGNQVYRRSDELGDYSITEGMTSSALCAKLSDAFQTSTTGTLAYNLRGQSLDNYIYPRLKVSRHYGDWAAPFQPASLVYFEKYLNNSYGYHGASVTSTLKDTVAVIGDGYGVVFKRGPGEIAPESITFNINGTYDGTIDLNARSYQVVAADGTVYDIYPLPAELVNAAPNGGYGFDPGEYYQKITVTSHTEHNGDIRKTYYFNPHFAKTVGQLANETDNVPKMPEQVGEIVSIRTPRHLYALSKYYDSFYRAATINTIDGQAVTVTFAQERDMDYALYDWTGFANELSRVRWQEPIGRNGGAFVATYDGRCNIITNISFVSESDKYVGMFGLNAGQLENVVIATDYHPKSTSHYYVQREKTIGVNETVCMGVLAGQNAGAIANCAVAGYYIAGTDGMLHAYANSTLYVGGLVGRNAGLYAGITATVKNSAADCPSITVSSTFANVSVGGFVGCNEVNGSIRNCYALGHLETADVRGGSVHLGGFAGKNDGKLNASYCAESMITSGVTVSGHGFAPAGGLVTDCCFLNDGTYTYVGALRDYNSATDPNITSGLPARYEELSGNLRTRTAYASGCYNHPNSTGSYPFRAVVSGRNGAAVHYGDWQIAPQLGTLGVFYWEHEEGGTNDGYRITYIGTAEGNLDSGTYLCTAHDDGGAVTEYGYGYYVKGDQAADVTVQSSGIVFSDDVWDTVAAAELHKQMGEYVFYPFRTRNATGEGDYICLDGSQRSGTWTLRYKGSAYTYRIAPFFANAMCREGAPSAILLPANDGDPDHYYDYSKTPGSAENPYEVRSVQQLQYINWNDTARNCSTLVTGEMDDPDAGNRQCFPYLQYATVVGSGIQTKSDATANRTAQSWMQTHDLDGTGFDGYTPIAGKATSSKSGYGASIDADRPAPLFAWFGGSYNGQSYKIQNLNIVSDSYTVGLFGVTVGADINNIILCGDGMTTVKRDTSAGTQVGNRVGAYQIGGLVALAYDYAGSDASSTISNCAISGYVIDDSSNNQHGLGYASVGGLFGVSQVELDRCSAVADIRINYCSPNGNNNKQVYSRYGNMIRVGGLTGTGLYSISDCYTGGSVTINPDTTLNEKPWGYKSPGYVAARSNSLQIFVGGIAGSVYKYGIVNFTGGSVTSDGTVDISNCYTYLTLPRMEGNVYAASIIVGPADRFHSGTFLNASNCYYLRDRVLANYESFAYIPREYTFDQKGRQISMLTEEEVENILFGDLDSLPKVLFDNTANKNHSSPDTAQQHSVSYNDLHSGFSTANTGMAALLNAGHTDGKAPWGWVSVTEPNGAAIDGKYSFSDEPGQEGKNYPFPTVITQPDFTFGGSVNVHYGAWPTDGFMWENGRDTLDILAQMDLSDIASAGGPYAEKTFRLKSSKGVQANGKLTFSVFPEDRAQYVSDNWNETEHCYEVTIRALKKGTVTVTAMEGDTALASFFISISGELKLEASPDEMLLYYNETAKQTETASLTATAMAKNAPEKNFTDSPYGTWTLETDQALDAILTVEDEIANCSVTGYKPGSYTLALTYQYNYHGGDGEKIDPDCVFTKTIYIPVRTLGYIGLSNGAGKQVSAQRTNTAGPVAVNDFIGDVEPIAPIGADVFLFTDAADGDLNAFTINKVTLTEQPGSAYVVFDAENPSAVDTSRYTASFFRTDSGAPDTETGDTYAYWGAAVRYLGEGSAPKLKVTVELTDPNGIGQYQLSVTLNTVYKYSVVFDSNGGSGVMRARGSNGGTFVLPDCTFTKPGYTFDCWLAGGETYQPDESIEITGSETVQAQWKPNNYTLHFDAGAGSGNMQSLTLVYDDDAQILPENGFTGPLNALRFAGWNTEADGRGTAYADRAEVRNLTTGAEITLYAQWASYRLTLDNDGSTQVYLPINGLETLPLYEKPVRPDWILDGWYTGTQPDAVQVLDAEGNIFMADVDGVTADGVYRLTGDAVLYARWQVNIMLTLQASDEPTDYRPELSEGALAGYTQPTREGWTLEGWYTLAEPGGTQVLNADGSIAANVDGYTADGGFALTETRTLYARWSWNGGTEITSDTPVNTKWDRTLEIDFSAGDYLEVVMDLSQCVKNKSNILGFGETNISTYTNNLYTFLIYYPHTETNRLLIREMRGQKFTVLFPESSTVTIRIDRDGISVNGTPLNWNEANYRAIIEHMTGLGAYAFKLGSQEGSNRDKVVYELIRVGREDVYG